MNIKSILFPTDFSEYNDAALQYASALAAEVNATLHIVHVHDVQSAVAAIGDDNYLLAPVVEEEIREARERLNKVLPTVASVTYAHHVCNRFTRHRDPRCGGG